MPRKLELPLRVMTRCSTLILTSVAEVATATGMLTGVELHAGHSCKSHSHGLPSSVSIIGAFRLGRRARVVPALAILYLEF
jgi:hypothetical protein